MGRLHRMRSLLTVPHPERTGGKQVFFGQLLVETTQHVVGVGKETANAVINQAEQNGARIDYTPGPGFFTAKDRAENILRFDGDVLGYLRLPAEDADSFHVSVRRLSPAEIIALHRSQVDLTPEYAVTLSVVASQAGELGEPGFWRQLGTNIWSGLTTDGPDRAGDPDARVHIVYGSEGLYRVIEGAYGKTN